MRLRTPKKFESKRFINRKHRRLIKRLRQSKLQKANDLADLLESCLKGEITCNSGACILCGRKIRLQFLSEISPFMRCADEFHMLTMVLSEFAVPKGQLNTLELLRIKQRYERLLRDHLPPNLMVVGGIDISLNSYLNKDFCWQVHIHAIVLKIADGPSINDVKANLKKAIQSNSDRILRPLNVKKIKVDEKSYVVSYCLKSVFEWRSGYLKTQNLRGRARYRATRGLSLKPDDEVELRIWLAQWTMAQRLILVGVANPASPNHIRLRLTSRTPEMSKRLLVPTRRQGCVTRSKKVKQTLADRRLKRARPRS